MGAESMKLSSNLLATMQELQYNSSDSENWSVELRSPASFGLMRSVTIATFPKADYVGKHLRKRTP